MTESLLAQVLGQIAAVAPAPADVRPDIQTGPRAVRTAVANDELAGRIAAARGAENLPLARCALLICAADHGLAVVEERSSTTPVTSLSVMRELAAGQSAIHALARSAQATVLLVDCGVAAPAGEPVKISPEVIDLRIGNGTHDVRQRPATTRARAALAIDSGVALGQSLADSGIDCIALGHIAEGAASILETACALLTGLPLNLLEPPHRPIAHALRDAHAHALADERDPLAILTALGGHAIGVMTGVILAAAANRVLVVLDDRGTSLAGLLAARLCPAVTGYLFASHLGQSAGHQQALYELGLTPLFDLGVARGQGEGAALALPALVDASARGTVAPR